MPSCQIIKHSLHSQSPSWDFHYLASTKPIIDQWAKSIPRSTTCTNIHCLIFAWKITQQAVKMICIFKSAAIRKWCTGNMELTICNNFCKMDGGEVEVSWLTSQSCRTSNCRLLTNQQTSYFVNNQSKSYIVNFSMGKNWHEDLKKEKSKNTIIVIRSNWNGHKFPTLFEIISSQQIITWNFGCSFIGAILQTVSPQFSVLKFSLQLFAWQFGYTLFPCL